MLKLELSSKLKSISTRSELVKSIKEQLTDYFDNLEEVRGSISLITEICIAIETMVKTKQNKKEIFMTIYGSLFDNLSEIEKVYLSEIVDYLCENGSVYPRTKFKRFLKSVFSIFHK